MAAESSKKVIIAALIGNSLIAVTKFAAATVTGSSAMFSEAVHSTVDTGNQLILLYGIRRARRPADAAHPFGYGREIYFWAFVVAVMIFATGAGVSVYEGVTKLAQPHAITAPNLNYLVLGLAMVFEGGSWWIAFREFRAGKGRLSYLVAIQASKDPTIFTVLLEDSAAMLGLVVAFLGIAAAQAFEIPELDGVASILIGLVLAVTAALLARETKGLLIGEAADPKVVDGVRRIARAQDGVEEINEVLTMHMGPRDVLLNLSLDFRGDLTSDQIEGAVSGLEHRIKLAFPEITKIFIEAQGREPRRRP